MSSQIMISGKPVGSVGFGMMSLGFPWKNIDPPAAAKIMKTALEHGANFWNGALFYGSPEQNSLHLLKYYFSQYPEDAEKVVLSIKGAYDHRTHTPTGSPEAIRASVDDALKILDGCKDIDVFEMARVDPKVPLEESIKTLAELVQEGKIGGVGLSEVNEKTIRRAAKITKIAAVEIELSLFTTDPLTNGIAEACDELDIPIAAYSPVGRGFLTGQIRKREDMAPDDLRLRYPRFQPDVFDQNLRLVEAVEQIARRKRVALAPVAIAWTTRQGRNIVAIPGASRAEQVVQNCTDVDLSAEELAEIEQLLSALPISGARYGGQFEALLNG